MMHDSLEQKMKEKLLEDLIDHMSSKMGDDMGSKFPHKAMEVSVAAPDKEKLAEGLEHAKDMTAKIPSHMEPDEDDEDRLMSLMGGDHDEDDMES